MKAIEYEIIPLLTLYYSKFYCSTGSLLLAVFILMNSSQAHAELNENLIFSEAYDQTTAIPKGVIEAVAYSMTHMKHIAYAEKSSCIGVPRVYGVMGLTLNGKGYFRDNLKLISNISGYSTQQIIADPAINVLAYAKAYEYYIQFYSLHNQSIEDQLNVVKILSELPVDSSYNSFEMDVFLYSVVAFLEDKENQLKYNFPKYTIDKSILFGYQNYKVLSSSQLMMHSDGSITNEKGYSYDKDMSMKGVDYTGANWNPTSCNFSSRSGTNITSIAAHTVQGSYSGCISWFKNCSANASAHYVVRSSDGQVTQMVEEVDKAWHVGSENSYTIGIEHEGYVSDSSWYTDVMYKASAALSKNIAGRRNINTHRTAYFPWAPTTNYNTTSTPGNCIKIKAHQHFPNQTHTDPGKYWDWNYYFKLIDEGPNSLTYTMQSGTIIDDGGTNAGYLNDQRVKYLISPTNQQQIQGIKLTVNHFELEDNWDYMYVYDGADIFAPLIGVYTGTNIPNTISSTGPEMLLEFRSDCATLRSGYEFSWETLFTGINEFSDNSNVQVFPNPLVSATTITLKDIRSQNVEAFIYNSIGDLISSKLIESSEEELFLGDIQSGIYFLKLRGEYLNKTIRLIKQ